MSVTTQHAFPDASTVTAALVDEIADHCRRFSDEAWDRVRTLVDMDSPSDDPAHLWRIAERAGSWWRDAGFDVSVRTTAGGLPVVWGERAGRAGAPLVVLIFHLDTVFPAGTAGQRGFSRDKEVARGPGVADMKSGLALALLAVDAASRVTGGLSGLSLRVICNTDEESDSAESRELLSAAADGAALALVFEPARPDGSVVVARRGVRRYRITVHGKAAHAGVDPWNGVNAVTELARKVVALEDLAAGDRSRSVTVSLISGGSRVNVVPDQACADIDVRTSDPAAASAIHADIQRISADNHHPEARSTCELLGERPPLTTHPDIERYLDPVRAAGQHLGVHVTASSTGGGGDGAFASALGVPTVDGLGPVGGGYHTADEYVMVASLVERAVMAACLLVACAGGMPTPAR